MESDSKISYEDNYLSSDLCSYINVGNSKEQKQLCILK